MIKKYLFILIIVGIVIIGILYFTTRSGRLISPFLSSNIPLENRIKEITPRIKGIDNLSFGYFRVDEISKNEFYDLTHSLVLNGFSKEVSDNKFGIKHMVFIKQFVILYLKYTGDYLDIKCIPNKSDMDLEKGEVDISQVSKDLFHYLKLNGNNYEVRHVYIPGLWGKMNAQIFAVVRKNVKKSNLEYYLEPGITVFFQNGVFIKIPMAGGYHGYGNTKISFQDFNNDNNYEFVQYTTTGSGITYELLDYIENGKFFIYYGKEYRRFSSKPLATFPPFSQRPIIPSDKNSRTINFYRW